MFLPLYKGHLLTMATFFCPQGGLCREAQSIFFISIQEHYFVYETGRLRPKVQDFALLYIIFEGKGSPFVPFLDKWCPYHMLV